MMPQVAGSRITTWAHPKSPDLQPVGRRFRTVLPVIRFKDICKHDLKLAGIDADNWEHCIDNHAAWSLTVKIGVVIAERSRNVQWSHKRARRKECATSTHEATTLNCAHCGKDCHLRVGLYSHA